MSKGSWVGGELWGSAGFRRGELKSRAVRKAFRHVPAEPRPSEPSRTAGICPFPGQTLGHLPRGAVGETLACLQEPVGHPQSTSPRCGSRDVCREGTCVQSHCDLLLFFFLTFEGFSLLSAGHFDLGHCTPSFLCRGGSDCHVPSQGHSSEGSDSQASPEPLGSPALLLRPVMQQV